MRNKDGKVVFDDKQFEKPIGLSCHLINIANGIRKKNWTTLFADIENSFCQAKYSGTDEL